MPIIILTKLVNQNEKICTEKLKTLLKTGATKAKAL